MGRPMLWFGLPLTRMASIRSLRPTMRPEDWGPRRSLPPLKTAKRRAHFGEAPQVLGRRKLCRGVDDDGHAMCVGDVDDGLQGQVAAAGHGALEPEDGGRLVGEGAFQFPFGRVQRRADLHELDAYLAHGVVVAVAVGAVDDDFVLEAGQVGKLVDGGRVRAGDAGGGGQDEAGSRAGADIGGFVAREFGQPFADALLQLVQVDEMAGGLLHGVEHFRRHDGAAELGERGAGVDDGLNAQVVVDAHGGDSPPVVGGEPVWRRTAAVLQFALRCTGTAPNMMPQETKKGKPESIRFPLPNNHTTYRAASDALPRCARS